MSLTIPLAIGLMVNVRPIDVPIEETDGAPNARVRDFDDHRITIVPIAAETDLRSAAFEAGASVLLTLSYAFAHKGARHVAETEVLSVSAGPGGPLLSLRRPEPDEYRRAQDRQYVRAPVRLRLSWRRLEEDDTSSGPWRSGEALDLSAGGVLIADLPLAVSDRLELMLPIEAENASLRGQVVRRLVVPWACGVKFTDVEAKVRETLVRFIFQRQLELRRKGLL